MVFIIQSIRLKENCKILRIKNVSYKLKKWELWANDKNNTKQ